MFANLSHESQENTQSRACKFHTLPAGTATAELDTRGQHATSRQPARAPEEFSEQNIRISEKNTNRGLKKLPTEKVRNLSTSAYIR